MFGTTLYFLERSWELKVPSWLYGTVPRVGFMVRVFQVFLSISMQIFSHHPVCQSHSTSSWISFRGNSSLWDHIFYEQLEEGNLGPSYVAILVIWKGNINIDETNGQREAIKLRKYWSNHKEITEICFITVWTLNHLDPNLAINICLVPIDRIHLWPN